jgi:hypothetical protein
MWRSDEVETDIPAGITRTHILAAIEDIKKAVPHAFGRSVFYDVLYQNLRYPPKAVVGLAAGKLLASLSIEYKVGVMDVINYSVRKLDYFEEE